MRTGQGQPHLGYMVWKVASACGKLPHELRQLPLSHLQEYFGYVRLEEMVRAERDPFS